MTEKIPLCRATIEDAEIQAVTDVLKSGWLTHGPKTTEFENMFAESVGVAHAIAMNSCTSALFLALLANDIHGEVIVPAFTFVATANAVVTACATPVFAEVQRETCNISAADIEPLITPRTEAVIIVHFAGQCCEMDDISALCERHGLLLIEDSAETIGGRYKDRQAGSWGIGCWSFFPTKNITTGEGGMLTTNDDVLANKVRALIGHGIDRTTQQRVNTDTPWARAAVQAGYNFRLSNILAAIGVEQMRRLDAMNEARRALSFQMVEELESAQGGIEVPSEQPDCFHVFQMFTIKVLDGRRDACVHHLRSMNIEASVHFTPPVHMHPYYRELWPVSLPVSEKISDEILTLPMYPGLKPAQVSRIAAEVCQWINSQR